MFNPLNNQPAGDPSAMFPSETPIAVYQQPKSKKKPLIVSAIVVALLAAVAYIYFVLVAPSFLTSKEETLPLVEDFQAKYSLLLEAYDAYVGFTPKNPSDDMVLPIPDGGIDRFHEIFQEADDSYNRFIEITPAIRDVGSGINADLKVARSNAESTLETIRNNLQTITDFNTAFVQPLQSAVENGDVPATCQLNDTAKELIENSDKDISSAAESYRTVLCKALEYVRLNKELDSAELQSLMTNAKASILNLLKPIDASMTGKEQVDNVYTAVSE